MNALQANYRTKQAITQAESYLVKPSVQVYQAIKQASDNKQFDVLVSTDNLTEAGARYLTHIDGYKVEYEPYRGEWPGVGSAPDYYRIKW
jgi:hypothetical protein